MSLSAVQIVGERSDAVTCHSHLADSRSNMLHASALDVIMLDTRVWESTSHRARGFQQFFQAVFSNCNVCTKSSGFTW